MARGQLDVVSTPSFFDCFGAGLLDQQARGLESTETALAAGANKRGVVS